MRVAGKGPAEPVVYQFKVTLKDIRPPIWRRFQVTNDITLHRLHLVLQAVMGWQNYHLYDFTIGGTTFGEPDPDFGLIDRNSRTTKLWQVLPGTKARFLYRYDFGDNWEHEMVLEKVLSPADGVRYPVCLAGARACPPEDCGGVIGYERMLEALDDPGDDEHQEYLDWLGGEFDPDAFDLEAVNRALERHRKKAPQGKRGSPGIPRTVSETPKVLTAAGKAKLGRFCERHGVTFLGVFGSAARGEAKADSDIDVIVQLSQPKSLLELVAMEDELSQLLNRKVDLLTEAAISPYLRERILAETVVLYEQAGR